MGAGTLEARPLGPARRLGHPRDDLPDRARGDAGVGQPPFFGDEERGYVRRQARTG